MWFLCVPAAACLVDQSLQTFLFAVIWTPIMIALVLLDARYAADRLKDRRPCDRADLIKSTLKMALHGTSVSIALIYLWVLSPPLALIFVLGVVVEIMVRVHTVLPFFVAGATPLLISVLGICVALLVDRGVSSPIPWVTLFGVLGVTHLVWKGVVDLHWSAQSLRMMRRAERAERQRALIASQAKTDFLAVISHELRTPMNAVMGSVEVLRRTNLDLQQREHLDVLSDSGAVLMALLNDVLDMSKIESGGMETEMIGVDMRRLAEGLERMWRPRALDKGVDMFVAIDPNTPDGVKADPTRLRQILFNLLSNAVKFTESGEIHLRIGVDRAAAAGEAVTLTVEVEDTGCGISTEAQARIFRPFQQADVTIARRYGGTGLGLSISSGLAEAMGATLTLKSDLGEGARFLFRLPTHAVKLEDAEQESLAFARPLQILVAEDHPANRRILGALLQPFGYDVIIAKDGKEVLDMFALGEFDLVLMDVQMPKLDGYEATKKIRASGGAGAKVPIVALTANAKDRERCLAAGMTDFVAKPIDPRHLNSVIVKAVNRTGDPGRAA
ncbi:MAG: ATP-binding protein [Pseudomonadota bacterium]